MAKHFSFIVVPHDNRRTWNFRVSYRLVYLFLLLVLVGLVSGGAFVFTYGRLALAAHHAASLGRENRRLEAQAAQIDSLKLELLGLQALSLQIKGMMGLRMSKEDSALVASLSPDARSPTTIDGEAEGGVDAIEQRTILQSMPSMWPVKGYVTREFLVTGGERNPAHHPGMDIAAERNTPVRAAADGIVVTNRYDETFGWLVEIDHGYGIRTAYGHSARNLVNVGDRVSRGKTIAFVGSTGKSTAPHLHFEIRENGVPVDPRKYLLN